MWGGVGITLGLAKNLQGRWVVRSVVYGIKFDSCKMATNRYKCVPNFAVEYLGVSANYS